jgi:hypothetical protein
MRYIKYLALLSVLMVPLAYSHAAVGVGIGVNVGPAYGYVGAQPVCPYGYYDYYPYACAPYGYYGSNWFVNGVFIGAGPWYQGYWGRDWDDRGWRDRGWAGRGWRGGHDFDRGERFHGGEVRANNGFHGGVHGNGGFHGGGFRGGRR